MSASSLLCPPGTRWQAVRRTVRLEGRSSSFTRRFADGESYGVLCSGNFEYWACARSTDQFAPTLFPNSILVNAILCAMLSGVPKICFQYGLIYRHVESSIPPPELWLENKNDFAANKSQPTFTPARRCKALICASGNSTAVADKSDDFLPPIIN